MLLSILDVAHSCAVLTSMTASSIILLCRHQFLLSGQEEQYPCGFDLATTTSQPARICCSSEKRALLSHLCSSLNTRSGDASHVPVSPPFRALLVRIDFSRCACSMSCCIPPSAFTRPSRVPRKCLSSSSCPPLLEPRTRHWHNDLSMSRYPLRGLCQFSLLVLYHLPTSVNIFATLV